MADLSRLKRNSLGKPPPATEASTNLTAPEVAPPAPETPTAPLEPLEIRDGRSARRSGRTLQFATRVSPEFDTRFRAIAQRDGLLLAELLERSLDAYEAKRKTKSIR